MPPERADPNRLPWYDSIWLSQFEWALDRLRGSHPGGIERLLAHTQCLRTDLGFRAMHLKSWISPKRLAELRAHVKQLSAQDLDAGEAVGFRRFVVRDDPFSHRLQAELVDAVSALAGEALYPVYNFLSLYGASGRCPLHLDAPEAKWTLDICIDQSQPWPIHFSRAIEWPTGEALDRAPGWDKRVLGDPSLEFETVCMEPGDAILFSGSAQWHYRRPLSDLGPRGFSDLLFMHFVPAGSFQALRPQCWGRDLGLPELDPLRLIPESDGIRRHRERMGIAE